MRKSDLCHVLRENYTEERGFGAVKTADPKHANIWFVVPPPPPKSAPDPLPLGALKRAQIALHSPPDIGESNELDEFVALLFRRREAVTSSRMEGTWSTIDHVLTPLESLQEDDETHAATASVRGYAEALETNVNRVLKKRYAVFTSQFIRNLHKSIVTKDPHFDGTPGALRQPGKHRDVVFIGGFRKENSAYNPAPPEHVTRSFNEVLAWFQDDILAEMGDMGAARMTLPVRLAVGHVHFEAVHPFQDGNGRVGRMLWPFQMMLSGSSPIYLASFVEAHKDEYGASLRTAQMKLKYGPFIEFMCEAIAQSHQEAERTKTALTGLPATWLERATFRKGSTAYTLLPRLISHPILTANTVRDMLGVSYQAANNAIASLQERGILVERTQQSRNRLFAAEEVLALVSKPFGADVNDVLKKVREHIHSTNGS